MSAIRIDIARFVFIFFLFNLISPFKIDAKTVQFQIKKGVNIGNWLESDIAVGQASRIFDVNGVDSLAKYGFDHIRIPVGENVLFYKDGSLNKDIWLLIHRVIRQCQKRNLRVVFDLHNVNEHYIDTWYGVKRESANLGRIWSAIMGELEVYNEELLAYELLNKPNSKDWQRWNEVSKSLIALIRSRNMNRVIVLGSNGNNKVDNVEYLYLPPDDPNIIVCFHYYEPSLLTKYRAKYTQFGKIRFREEMKYPGILVTDENFSSLNEEEKKIVAPYRKKYDRNYIKLRFRSAIKFASRNKVVLYLSEFGCLPNNGKKTRLAWLKDVVSVCDEFNIPFCLWEYNSGFGFADRKTGKVSSPEVLKTILD